MIFAPICEYYNNYRGADERRIILKNKWRDLERRKLDTASRLEAQLLPGKKPKEEVQGWIQDVEMMNDEIEAIEHEAGEGKCFSRAHIGKLALKKIGEVEELYQRGAFTDSLVIDPPPSNGEIMSTPTLIGESTAERVKEEIWAWLLDDDVRKIGLYGMGGIGKSTVMEHINNRILKEKKNFDFVIWVTVSKSLNVIQLQHEIACKLKLDFTEVEDERGRAAKLKAELEKRKRFVLILDDMWKAFTLAQIGIPEPNSANGCKLVLTTRLHDVCLAMSCKDIRMKLLSKEEARKLFLDIMERDVFKIPNLKPMAEDVLKVCAQLPLAIVTIAASFKPLIKDYEWRVALEELKTSVIRTNDEDEQVLEKLKFSYERLKGEKLKQCLLHCALFPEDFKINKQELIEHLIDEGIIERKKSRQAEFDMGYTILSKLENACLLEGGNDFYKGEFVKMHDLVRDMVLRVASPEFKVGHLGLEDFSDEGKWREDLVKASSMFNKISRIPSNVSPMCPNLSTLLLQNNRSLEAVPDSLFKHLHVLKVLDLSYTGIKSLPNSVFSLENLTTLRLRMCRNLKQVPSLAKLTTLRKLDLWETKIREVPDGLEMLVNLTYLTLYLKVMPLGILPKLYHLQYLVFDSPKVNEEEIASLKELETFVCNFDDVDKFSTYIRAMENRQLACYRIQVGKKTRAALLYRLLAGCMGKNFCKIFSGKEVILSHECNLKRGDESLVLPKDVQFLQIVRCHDLRSLCDVPSLRHTSQLQGIKLKSCQGIQHILSFSSSCILPLLQTLEKLELWNLRNLRVLFRKEKAADEFEEEELEEKGMDTTKITLPKLRVLSLRYLPELKTICSSSKVIVCDSLETIEIRKCPKLKRLPLSLPLPSNGQLSPPPSLKEIVADEEWWESLEWDSPDTKNILQPFVHSHKF
uniref:NB-ARC domain-containing protein n=2 Tax=Quercus lobata TaxID=97700 RepID=A0A7N2MB87_QUELO